jgi:hypothetical protein
VTNGTNDSAAAQPATNRTVIPATCMTHGGCRGFTNVVLTKADGKIVLDPHATGGCVIEFDETQATAVRDQFSEWLG